MVRRYSILGFFYSNAYCAPLLGAFGATPASARTIVDDVVDTASTYVCQE